ncbi:hypothetical protein LZ30DRAFT_81739 [Colletotrichum cereale]|nr:hypothetical protein LZ30DRAFT_81739 [Colletotrichum cereale]
MAACDNLASTTTTINCPIVCLVARQFQTHGSSASTCAKIPKMGLDIHDATLLQRSSLSCCASTFPFQRRWRGVINAHWAPTELYSLSGASRPDIRCDQTMDPRCLQLPSSNVHLDFARVSRGGLQHVLRTLGTWVSVYRRDHTGRRTTLRSTWEHQACLVAVRPSLSSKQELYIQRVQMPDSRGEGQWEIIGSRGFTLVATGES